ncbi:MAG: NUDIX domain-containing protein [Rhodoblastus sp.]
MLAMEPTASKDVAPARPASTVLLVRDSAEGMEVFMVVRHHQIDFASGALVFPGGSIDKEDAVIAADVARCGGDHGLDEQGRAFRVAAVRETFEECGVLLARPRGATALVDGARVAEIARKAAGRSFGELIAEEDLELALDKLTPFAHWVTPTPLPKRFDTHFFIAAAPEDQLALHDGSESVDSVWINPTRALAEAKTGKYTIIFATRLNVEMLGRQNDVAAAIDAARVRKIVTVQPEVLRRDDKGVKLRIPLEADYGGDLFES